MRFWQTLAAAIGAVTVLQFVLVPFGALAEEGRKTSRPRIQIPSLMAPIIKSDGRHGMIPLTLVMEVVDVQQARKLCLMLPVVQDAVLQSLYAHELRQGADGKLDVTGLQARLIGATNESLGAKVVSNTVVYEGIPKAGPGGAKFAGWQMCRDVGKSKSE